jgi:hypothetical protein
MKAQEVYEGSDGKVTTLYYAHLIQRGGELGTVAMNLFRAQKCSARAKVYRGGIRGRGSFKSMAYERKSWSMGLLCDALATNAETLGIAWGWKEDPHTPFGNEPSWVLYVELPEGMPAYTKDGNKMFSNTHFKTENEAWNSILRSVEAFISLSASSLIRARADLQKAEKYAADAVVEYMTAKRNYERRMAELINGPTAPPPAPMPTDRQE